MRLLLDENVPAATARLLTDQGHDVLHVQGFARGTSDPAVLAKANADRRVLLTFDKDFGDLVVWGRLPAVEGVVLFRLGARTQDDVLEVLCQTMAHPCPFAGHLIVVGERRVRIRPLAPRPI